MWPIKLTKENLKSWTPFNKSQPPVFVREVNNSTVHGSAARSWQLDSSLVALLSGHINSIFRTGALHHATICHFGPRQNSVAPGPPGAHSFFTAPTRLYLYRPSVIKIMSLSPFTTVFLHRRQCRCKSTPEECYLRIPVRGPLLNYAGWHLSVASSRTLYAGVGLIMLANLQNKLCIPLWTQSIQFLKLSGPQLVW